MNSRAEIHLFVSESPPPPYCRFARERLKPEGKCKLVAGHGEGGLYVVCGCETWSATLEEEHRLRVFENRVLRRIFGPKRDEVTGEWRKLHSGQLHNLYSSPDIIRQIRSRRMRWAGHVARMRKGRNMYRVLVGNPEGNRPLERPRRRWEDGIKVDLREIVWGVGSGFSWLRTGTGGGLL
jgi:hypothetical protein